VESAEIFPSPLALARNDLSAARVSVLGRLASGGARDLADGVFEYVVTDPAGHDLPAAADERGRLLRVFNGRSTLDAQVFGGPPATGFIEAALLDNPLVPARIEVGRPVTATFLETVSAPPLQFVSARVATADGEEQRTAATLEDDGKTVTVTPAGCSRAGGCWSCS